MKETSCKGTSTYIVYASSINPAATAIGPRRGLQSSLSPPLVLLLRLRVFVEFDKSIWGVEEDELDAYVYDVMPSALVMVESAHWTSTFFIKA